MTGCRTERRMVGEVPHSTAHPVGPEGTAARDDVRLSAPSAARNIPPILDAIAPYLPERGYGLELASGTGEHAIAYAGAFPGIVWQPTDIAPERLDSIDAWRARAGHRNMRIAQFLDASAPGWKVEGFDVLMTVNLLHLISEDALREVVAGVARSLEKGGRWCLYGPFRMGGQFRSDGDRAFDARLRGSDAAIGYKAVEDVTRLAEGGGLTQLALIEMPANNLLCVFEKTA
ncbi:class I SAM-dependent methyltransferase [Aliiroseovarius crassostreae]|nr:class I SAM-dependent methyltransferase [Aliiroseovarius crassostreae]